MKEPLGQDFFFYICKSNFQTFQIMIFYAPYVVVKVAALIIWNEEGIHA